MDQANLYNPECETISREELEHLAKSLNLSVSLDFFNQ